MSQPNQHGAYTGTVMLWRPVLRPVGYPATEHRVEILSIYYGIVRVRVLSPLRPGEPTDWIVDPDELWAGPAAPERPPRQGRARVGPVTEGQRRRYRLDVD